jgi:hypothetical protein
MTAPSHNTQDEVERTGEGVDAKIDSLIRTVTD